MLLIKNALAGVGLSEDVMDDEQRLSVWARHVDPIVEIVLDDSVDGMLWSSIRSQFADQDVDYQDVEAALEELMADEGYPSL